MTERRDETIEELFDRGLEVRRAVLGPEYVDNSLKSANDFMMAFQNITTEWCWGYAWTRSGLDRKTRRNIFSNSDGTPSQLFFSHIGGLQKYLPAAMALSASGTEPWPLVPLASATTT